MSFSHRDGRRVITPFLGPRAGQPLVLKSAMKVSFDPGGKTSYGKGIEQTPVFIIRGSAEPKLSIDFSSADEAWAAVQWVNGIGGSTFMFSDVYTRPAFATRSWLFIGCELTTGGGYDSDDANGVAGKLEIALKNALLDGTTIYTPRFPA